MKFYFMDHEDIKKFLGKGFLYANYEHLDIILPC